MCCGLGIDAAGGRLTCCVYADDAQVFLPGLGVLPLLLDVMGVFGRVTGQHLQLMSAAPPKTQALIGLWSGPRAVHRCRRL